MTFTDKNLPAAWICCSSDLEGSWESGFHLTGPVEGQGVQSWGEAAEGLGEGPGGQVSGQDGKRRADGGTEKPAPSPRQPLPSRKMLGKSLSLPVPQFPHLSNPEEGRGETRAMMWVWCHQGQSPSSATHWVRD